MTYEVAEINDFARFVTLEPEWNELLSQSDCDIPFLRHEWFRNWIEHFGMQHRLALIVVRFEGNVVLVLPLLESHTYDGAVPVRTLESLGNRHSFRFDCIVRRGREDAVESVIDYLRKRPKGWDVLRLEDVRGDSPGCNRLLKAAQVAGMATAVWRAYESPFISVAGGWDDYYAGLKSKFRSNMRNRNKRLAQEGEVGYETITKWEEVRESLSEAFDIERRSWKGREGSAIACVPQLVSFYKRWAQIASEHEWLRLSFLSVARRRVAFDLSIIYGGRTYCMKIGFDPEYRAFSVGQMLCGRMIQACFDAGNTEYDFLGEWTEQKADWMPRGREHAWLYICNRTWRGRWYRLYKFGVKQRLKAWVGR